VRLCAGQEVSGAGPEQAEESSQEMMSEQGGERWGMQMFPTIMAAFGVNVILKGQHESRAPFPSRSTDTSSARSARATPVGGPAHGLQVSESISEWQSRWDGAGLGCIQRWTECSSNT
jgi:hypothetical protein